MSLEILLEQLDHPSLLVQFSAAKKLKNLVSSEGNLTKLLETVTDRNINAVLSVIKNAKVDPLTAVLSILPSAKNVGPLFSIVFGLAKEKYFHSEAEIHPFVEILNSRPDYVEEWLERFPLKELLDVPKVEHEMSEFYIIHFYDAEAFENLQPCFYLPKAQFGRASPRLMEKMLTSIVSKYEIKTPSSSMEAMQRELKYAYTMAGCSSSEEDDEGLFETLDPFQHTLDMITKVLIFWKADTPDSSIQNGIKLLSNYPRYTDACEGKVSIFLVILQTRISMNSEKAHDTSSLLRLLTDFIYQSSYLCFISTIRQLIMVKRIQVFGESSFSVSQRWQYLTFGT